MEFKDYRKHGVNLLPISTKTKEPFMSWKKYQTEFYNGPLGNAAAVITGPLSNLMVVDVDNLPLFKSWCAEHDWTPKGIWRERTPSGGLHVFFRYDDSIQSHFKKAAIHGTLKKYGFELMLERSLIKCAPSVMADGSKYGPVFNPFEPGEELPEWIMRALLECEEPKKADEDILKKMRPYHMEPEEMLRRTPVLRLLGEGRGRRNYILFGFGQRLAHSRNTWDDVVRSGIIDIIDDYNFPDLPKNEISTQIRRGIEKVIRDLNSLKR